MQNEGDGDDQAVVPRLPRIPNENQRRLLWFIHQYPGLNSQELAEMLDVSRTSVVYHARRLEREGLIAQEKQGPHKLHFPAKVASSKRKALAVLRVESIRAVAMAVYASPRCSVRLLVERTGLNPRTVRRALQALRHDRLAYSERNGRGQLVHLHPDMRLVLARWSDGAQGDASRRPPRPGDR